MIRSVTTKPPARGVPEGCATLLAIPVVLLVVLIIGLVVSANERAAWEAESGTAAVSVEGMVETESWLIRSARLETNAEYHTTKLIVALDRKRSPGIGGLPRLNPGIVVSVGGTTCERRSGRLYSEELSLQCRAFLPLERIREIATVEVHHLG